MEKVFSVFQSFLRPYIKKSDMQDSVDQKVTIVTAQQVVMMTLTFLWVHQEKWQQETMALIDATYKTTKYEVALFFCV